MTPSIVIAGVSSGVGKTTITLGLIAALSRRNLIVQPFKAGPDYIDPTYHALAAGRPCRNIDTWMVPLDRALSLFDKAAQQADLAVVEGVMGLFDGFSYEQEEGSTAQIAKYLKAPVLLILDVGKMARSAGALALGYTTFDPNLDIAGFILNHCGSESHYQGAKLAIEQATALPVLGWLPKDSELHIPERHLGLVPTNERGELDAFINHAAQKVETYFDLDAILAQAKASGKPRFQTSIPSPQTVGARQPGLRVSAQTNRSPGCLAPTPLLQNEPDSKIRLAVARDSAFSFYYEDNLDLLREAGAEIIFFSPQEDEDLPPEISGLYLGGGFPEIYATQLAANELLRDKICQAHSEGMPIYAECGGFMYLCEAIIDLTEKRHPMVGLIPGVMQMQPRLISLGYRLVESPTGNFLLSPGVTVRGHEFHWSRWLLPDEILPPEASAWHIRPHRGQTASRPEGYTETNLVASYIHLHFACEPQLARNFVQTCSQWRDRQLQAKG